MDRLNGRYLTGLIIIAFGVIALLNNFDITNISLGYLFNLLWPLLLAIVGINFIVSRHDLAGIVTGAILISLGVIFFGRNAGFFDINMKYFWQGFWPIIIILIGLSLLGKNQHNNSGHLAIMGAVEKNQEVWDIKSGEYTAIMGGIELDVRKAHFTEKEVSLGLTAIMGGITLIIPEDVAVSCKGTAILGGINLIGKESGGIVGSTSMEIGDLHTASKILHLSCTCLLGGIEIKR